MNGEMDRQNPQSLCHVMTITWALPYLIVCVCVRERETETETEIETETETETELAGGVSSLL